MSTGNSGVTEQREPVPWMFFHPEPALLLFSISKVRFIYLEECIRLHIFIICQIGLFPQSLLIFGNRICHQFIVDSLKPVCFS